MEEKKIDVTTSAPEVKVEKPADGTAAPAGERNYKAEFEATQKELGQAQHVIKTLKEKEKKKEESAGSEEEQVEVDPEKIDEVVSEKLEAFKKEQTQDTFADELARLTDNPDKLALIKLHYDKSIVKSGFSRAQIRNDLANALAIVDKPRLDKTISEMKQTAISKQTMNAAGSTTGQDIAASGGEVTEETLTPSDRKLMARHGLTLKDINKK